MTGPVPKNPAGGEPGLSYRAAGVDIDAGDALVDRIKPLAARTRRPGVLAGIGGFGGLFALPTGLKAPVLVSGTDGVGTKLKLAFLLDRHDTIGIDLVAMSVNDILVQGAEPLYFLDYFACGRLDVDRAAAVVGGIAAGCEQSGCALLGGETAEMPGMYPDGEYDLAGFAVGVVERDRIIDGSRIVAGDRLLGLASSGPHSNGYSLIRRVIARASGLGDGGRPAQGVQGNQGVQGKRGAEEAEAIVAMRRFLARPLEGASGDAGDGGGSPPSLAQAVMAPTRLYVKSLLPLFADPAAPIKGLAHITGGGLVENIPRVLPDGLQAVVEGSAWQRPAVFDWLQAQGGIDDAEMVRVFNCGIGMVVVVAAADADRVTKALIAAGETVFALGEVRPRPAAAAATIVV